MSINIILNNMIRLDPLDFPAEVIKGIKDLLRVPNPAKNRAEREMLWGAKKLPEYIELWDEPTPRELVLPRGHWDTISQFAHDYDLDLNWIDRTSFSEKLIFDNDVIPLRDYQLKAADSLCNYNGGIYKSSTGSGKSITMLAVVRACQQKTIIICEKSDIAQQWIQFAHKLGFDVGAIGSGEWDDKKDLIIALRQSLWNRCYQDSIDRSWFNQFGMVIWDECFPLGTLINTPSGRVPIENLTAGEEVYGYDNNNNIVITEIKRTFKKDYGGNLVGVGGVKMTPEHPVWTPAGYKAAQKVTRCDMMGLYDNLNETEKLRVVPATIQKDSKGTTKILQQLMQERSRREQKADLRLRVLWERIQKETRSCWEVLLKTMLLCFTEFQAACEPEHAFAKFSARGAEKTSRLFGIGSKSIQWRDGDSYTRKRYRNTEREWIRSSGRWQWKRFNYTSEDFDGRVPRVRGRGNTKDWFLRSSLLVWDRFSPLGFYVSNRGRWKYPYGEKNYKKRRKKGQTFRRMWLGHSSLYKQRNSKRIRECKKDYYKGDVCNLETGTGNYFAENLLVHNCHHLKAETAFDLVQRFPARYRFGCSATPDSDPDLFPFISAAIGPVVAFSPIKEIGDHLVIPSVRVVDTEFTYPYRPTLRRGNKVIRNNYSSMMKALEEDEDRNKLIADTVYIEANKGNHCLVISKRKNHLNEIIDFMPNYGEDKDMRYFTLTGDISSEYSRIKNEIDIAKSGTVTFSTLAEEGTDVPIWNRLFLSYPGRKLRFFEQAIGRIMRPFPGKKDAIVYDFRDKNVSLLNSQFRFRCQGIYNKKNYIVDTIG